MGGRGEAVKQLDLFPVEQRNGADLPSGPSQCQPAVQNHSGEYAKQLDLFPDRKPQGQVANEERWVEVVGFPRYEVSSEGRFRQKESHYIMKQGKEINGYSIVLLTRSGHQYCKLAHRLVCESFNGPPTERLPLVNHINRDKGDNRPCNLEWISRSGNAKHWRVSKALNANANGSRTT
jgi:hypothetical protein